MPISSSGVQVRSTSTEMTSTAENGLDPRISVYRREMAPLGLRLFDRCLVDHFNGDREGE